ncbi:polymorphic toxin-type HINT domain-containing protein [Streptomyces sp. NPDC020983]|uniref:polymorphic toxin-type HINT domain-containing protein n=1 Tax=Streptomyces sp. NPDC020983 TaxID=3365106 RepID=UPI0037AAD0A6
MGCRGRVPASQLRVGHRLQTENGATVSVVALRAYTAEMVTYNLAVDNLHTYFVLAGATPILVHNRVGGITVYRGVSRISGQTG